MKAFELHARLATDTYMVLELQLCRVLLMNDQRYPWLVLVPRRADLTELYQLSAADRLLLTRELDCCSHAIRGEAGVVKLNVASLGNLVPQLHVHLLGRCPGDPAWPGPVWGHSEAVPYPSTTLPGKLSALRARLLRGGIA